MLSILFAFLSAGFITYVAIPSIIRVAEMKHLFDVPDERKQHKTQVPTLGGIAIFAGTLISFSFWADFHNFEGLHYLISALVIILFVGMKDDLVPLAVRKKLFAQIVAAIFMVVLMDVRISSMQGFFGIHEISYPISIALTIFVVLALINAYNIIDGIDGLAGTIGVSCSILFGVLFFVAGSNLWSTLSFALVGSLVAFLYYNITPAKIFMGDTGSLLIGFILSLLAVQFISRETGLTFISSKPIIALAILIVPLFDLIRVMIIRLSNKQSPFKADNNHIHHVLLSKGYGHKRTTIVITFFGLIVGLMAILMDRLIIDQHFILAALIMACLIFSFIIKRLKPLHTID